MSSSESKVKSKLILAKNLNFNHEKLKDGQSDKQFMMQYVISIGAHGAHAY